MDILKEVIAIVAEILNGKVEEIKVESKLVEDLGSDELDNTEIVLALEDKFGIVISEEEQEKLASVQDIVNLVTEKTTKVKESGDK
jgi:acyl carrier protein